MIYESPYSFPIGYLCLETETPLEPSDAHLLRGYVCNLFPYSDLLHNHDESGRNMYRYPRVQYKVVHGIAMIVAIEEDAIEILRQIEACIEELILGNRTLKVTKTNKILEVKECTFGISSHLYHYVFLSPCLLLNAEKYREYKKSNEQIKKEILTSTLTGNLLSTSKGLKYHVQSHIYVEHSMSSQIVCLKGQDHLGFNGFFLTNFHLPDFLGIGKSASRGYGTLLQCTGA